jgi:hypothetical protein
LIPSKAAVSSARGWPGRRVGRNWRQILSDSPDHPGPTTTANPWNTQLRGAKPDGDAVVVCGADQALTRCWAAIRAPQLGAQLWFGAGRAVRIKLQTDLAEALLGTAARENPFDGRKFIRRPVHLGD